MNKSVLAPYLLVLLVVFVFVFFSVGCSQKVQPIRTDVSIDTEDTLKVSTAVITDVVTIETVSPLTPIPSPSPKPTQTLVDTPTSQPTPVPTERIWPREVWEEFMFGHDRVGERLIQSGWNKYDNTELLDNYPCYLYNLCPANSNSQNLSAIMSAYAQNSSGDFWCEWACEGVYHGFSPYVKGSRVFTYQQMHFFFGDPSKEPYCPQFAVDVSTDFDFYFKDGFNCSVEQVLEPLPYGNLGWSEETRNMVEKKYLRSILEDGFPDEFYGDGDGNWTVEEVENLTDLAVCDIVADGHYMFGFPDYFPYGTYYDDKTGVETLRMRNQLRERLQKELGESVAGSEPLCPGFLDLIDDRWLQ